MKHDTKKIISFMVIALLWFSCTVLISNNASSSYNATYNAQSNQLPFNDFYLHYQLKAQKDTSPLFNIDMNISYTLLNPNSSNTYDYQQKMVIKSFLLKIIGEQQENATFVENSNTRNFKINSTEGAYIEWLIYHVSAYNNSVGGLNWDPFWIVPQQVNDSYPIYSLNMNLTQRTVLNPYDMALFNTYRPILIFNGIQNITTSYENITNTIGLIYDNSTGILLKGVLDSVIVGTSATNHYYANFELHDSNALESPNTTSTSSTTQPIIPPALQKPNYFLLTVILALPLLITIIRFFRLKEISGGTD